MLPWVICDRRSRFLIAVVVIGWLGLIIVVWSMRHYAAPLTAVSFAHSGDALSSCSLSSSRAHTILAESISPAL